jgi:hypothetical protein
MPTSCPSGQCPIPKAKPVPRDQITPALFDEIVGALAVEPYEIERACSRRGVAYPNLVTWVNSHADAKALAARLYNGLADYHERRVYHLDVETVYRVQAGLVRKLPQAASEVKVIRHEERLMREHRERAWLLDESNLSFIDYGAQKSVHPRHGEQAGRGTLYLKNLKQGASDYAARYFAGLPVAGDPDMTVTALRIMAKHRAQPPLPVAPDLWPVEQEEEQWHNLTRESEIERLRDMENLVMHEAQRLRRKYGSFYRHAA